MKGRDPSVVLEHRHEDITPPELYTLPAEDIRERMNALAALEVEETPVPRFVVAKGSGKVNLTEGLKRHLRQHPEKLDAFYESIVDRAIAGDHNATKLVFDRVEGAVPQRIGVGQLTTEQIAEMLQLDADQAGS